MKLALVAVATAAVYSLAYPPFEAELLLWVALVPLLHALGRARPAAAAWAGAAFGAGIAAFIVAWVGPTLVGYYERPWWFAALLLPVLWLTMGAPFYAVACGALAFARPHLSRTAWLLLIPCAWVAAEWSRTRLGLQASWALVGDAFHAWPRLRQIADVTAVYGVSFVVVLGNVFLLEVLLAARDASRRNALKQTALAFGLVLAIVTAYGQLRVAQLARAVRGEPLDLVLVQGNVEPRLRWQRTAATRVLHRYAGLTRDAVALGPPPDLVIWPENALQTSVDDPVYGPPLEGLVRILDVPILLGAPRQQRDEAGLHHFNSAFLVAPGAATDHYDKRRLMPFGESDPLGAVFETGRRGDLDAGRWAAGTRPGLFEVDGRLLGALICLEAIYPETARELVASGAQALVNLSNDGWFQGRGGPEQHFQQTRFRAIELRRPLVRVTTTGVTAVVEPDGTLRERLPFGEPGVLRVSLEPGADVTTFYTRFGDVFAGGCTAVLGGAVLLAAARRRAPTRWR